MYTSFGMDAIRDAKSNHPASFLAVAATGFRLYSVNIFFETSSTNPGNLQNLTPFQLITTRIFGGRLKTTTLHPTVFS